ncbi:MAG: formate dehydrogenase accessory sulfurtransferase FdhD [Emcibacter sp.]|nr:formate dehydrogenase accessory sulfurtransferase FdhD [Emcibacter sp.]
MIDKLNKPTGISRAIIWRPENTALEKAKIEERHLSCEIPLALEYNCISHAVMMISPIDVEDFTIGFSLTEGIINGLDDIIDIKISAADKGFIASLEIVPECFERLDQFKRTLAGRTGCGLCGIDRLDHAISPLNPIKSNLKINAHVIYNSMQNLSDLQIQNHLTGALHAAAFVDKAGDILCVREDIGRHNALDKLIGHMMQQKIDPSQGVALITSRCSFEMVHKCATFGIPVLAAVSATTDLALKLAEDSGLSLIAFTRKEGMNIYCDPKGRIY